MKTTCLALSIIAAFAATSANAATVLGFKVGGDVLWGDSSGTITEQGGEAQGYQYDDKTNYSIWFNVEHPLPFLPNLKIRENHFETDGSLSDASYSYRGVSLSGAVKSNVDLANTDFILYYELLDNDIFSLDAGAAYKKFDGSYRVYQDTYSDTIEIDNGVFMGYVNAEIGVVGTGLFAYAEALAGIDHSDIQDYQAGIGWQFDGIALDTRVKVGYRKFQFQDDDFSDVSTDMSIDGVYAGVEVVF